MNYEYYVRQGLYLQEMPVFETDIPYILSILSTINQTQVSLKTFPNLNSEQPIKIVDKGLIYFD